MCKLAWPLFHKSTRRCPAVFFCRAYAIGSAHQSSERRFHLRSLTPCFFTWGFHWGYSYKKAILSEKKGGFCWASFTLCSSCLGGEDLSSGCCVLFNPKPKLMTPSFALSDFRLVTSPALLLLLCFYSFLLFYKQVPEMLSLAMSFLQSWRISYQNPNWTSCQIAPSSKKLLLPPLFLLLLLPPLHVPCRHLCFSSLSTDVLHYCIVAYRKAGDCGIFC